MAQSSSQDDSVPKQSLQLINKAVPSTIRILLQMILMRFVLTIAQFYAGDQTGAVEALRQQIAQTMLTVGLI